MQPEAAGKTESRPVWSPRWLWLLLPIALVLILFFALDLRRFVSLTALREHQVAWRGFIQDHLVAGNGDDRRIQTLPAGFGFVGKGLFVLLENIAERTAFGRGFGLRSGIPAAIHCAWIGHETYDFIVA